jgi:hypothetical protein
MKNTKRKIKFHLGICETNNYSYKAHGLNRGKIVRNTTTVNRFNGL